MGWVLTVDQVDPDWITGIATLLASVIWDSEGNEGQQTKQLHQENRTDKRTTGSPEGSAALSVGENLRGKCSVNVPLRNAFPR